MGRGSTGAIIALVFFVLTSGLMGWGYYSQYNKVERRPEAGGIKGLKYQLDDAIGERKAEEEKLTNHQKDLVTKKTEHRAQTLRERVHKVDLQSEEILQLSASGERAVAVDWKKMVPDKNEMTLKVSKDAVGAFTTRKDDAGKKNDQRIKEITAEIGRVTKEIEDFKKKVDAEKKKLEKGKTGLRNLQSDYERKVEELVTREAAPGLPPVGRVLTSDPEHNLAVVNLGTRHGTRPGMRFEVFQLRRGNQRVHKGYLEVKTAHPEVASCAILVKEVRLPRCPVCGYTGTQPEELYCPRCTRPGTSQGAQRLSDAPKIVIRGKILTDPIVKGDLLFNPFFSPGKKKRYAVSGRPLIIRHKDFSVASIKKAVEFHGNIIDKRLNARTQVLVALRGGEDLKRAKELGIPVVYGWELFRYLER